MKSKFLLVLVTSCLFFACSQQSKPKFDAKVEEVAIRAVISAEQIAWNNGDIDAFMEGFWKSDSLQFISARGLSRGWEATRENYIKGFHERSSMGTVSYQILSLTPLAQNIFILTCKYEITQEVGKREGIFTAIFKKVNGKWLAVHYHAS